MDVKDPHFTTIIQIENGKEIYRMTGIKELKEIDIAFNPYTMEIILLK